MFDYVKNVTGKKQILANLLLLVFISQIIDIIFVLIQECIKHFIKRVLISQILLVTECKSMSHTGCVLFSFLMCVSIVQ